MSNFLKGTELRYKAVKEVIGVLRQHNKYGKPLGFRVRTPDNNIADVSIDTVEVEIVRALQAYPPVLLYSFEDQLMTKEEHATGKSYPDFSSNREVIESLQFHIYAVEGDYRNRNSTDVYEVSFEFMYKNRVKRLSGYLQAQDEEHAVGAGKSYIAQVYGVDFFNIGCPYVKPFYEKVDWGVQSPLLAIKLTLEPKWNKVILPKIKAK